MGTATMHRQNIVDSIAAPTSVIVSTAGMLATEYLPIIIQLLSVVSLSLTIVWAIVKLYDRFKKDKSSK